MRRSRCFVLDLSLNLRDSYSVKTKAYSYAFYVYASSLHLLYIEFCISDDAKVIHFILRIKKNRSYLPKIRNIFFQELDLALGDGDSGRLCPQKQFT